MRKLRYILPVALALALALFKPAYAGWNICESVGGGNPVPVLRVHTLAGGGQIRCLVYYISDTSAIVLNNLDMPDTISRSKE